MFAQSLATSELPYVQRNSQQNTFHLLFTNLYISKDKAKWSIFRNFKSLVITKKIACKVIASANLKIIKQIQNTGDTESVNV